MALRTWQLPLALLLAWATSSGATAQAPAGPRIQLEAKLPRSLKRCVSAEQLEASYERARQTRVAADTQIREDPAEFQVQLRSLGASGGATQIELAAQSGARSLGTRVLPVRADDCKALPDTLALVLWLLSQSAEPAPEPPPPPPAPPPAAPAVAPRDPEVPPGQGPPPPPPPSAPSTTHLGVGLGGALALGVLPRAALQLQLLAVLRVPVFEGRLRAAVLWPQTMGVAEGRVAMRSYEVALEICPHWQVSDEPALELRGCLGPRFGLLRATSTGFAVQNPSNTELLVYAAATAEAALAVSESSWLQFAAGLGIAFRRPRFVLNFESAQPPMPIDGPELWRGEIGLSFVQLL